MNRFAIRRLDETGVVPLGNLIKGDLLHVITEGNAAMAQIEDQGNEACRKALERGRQEGAAEGRQTVAALMTNTAAAAQRFWQQSERRLVGIVVDALRRIIGEIDGSDVVAGLVEQLLGEVRDEGKIRLRVSPDQIRDVENRIVELSKKYSDIASIEVIGDRAVEQNACCVETELGVVNTSVEAQIESLRTALEVYFDTPEPTTGA